MKRLGWLIGGFVVMEVAVEVNKRARKSSFEIIFISFSSRASSFFSHSTKMMSREILILDFSGIQCTQDNSSIERERGKPTILLSYLR